MGIVLTNAMLVDLDPPRVEHGSLRIEDGVITARGNVASQAGDETIDCGGCIVLPGFINGHTHLYSSLATGMPAPTRPPANFLEILQRIWWRLDQALDAESIETSAQLGALEALRCGTTTLIDHHASPNHIENSLDLVEHGVDSVGLRGVLCYETTDRHGRAGREAGLAENGRYLAKRAANVDGRFAGLVGAHASFTLQDESLAALAALAARFEVGVHIHVAEDPCDEVDCRERFRVSLIDRMARFDLLSPRSIFAHCTHLDDDAINRVNPAGLHIAHNPRSNMNNAVGYAPIGRLRCPIMLGTDGIGADMLAEAKFAWFKSHDAHAGISPNDVVAMLVQSARRASVSLGVELGKLKIGAAADIIITDHLPPAPLTADNLAAHLIFRISSQHVRHVVVAGKVRLRDRIVIDCDEAQIHRRANDIAKKLWQRMEHLSIG